jgi:hypothetical protein
MPPQQAANPASAWTPVDESAWQAVDETPAQQTPQTPLQKAFGNNPVSDTLSTVGSHLKNLAYGPYHALVDEPKNDTEQDVVNQGGGGAFGRYVGLPLDRMLGASASMDSAQRAKGLTGDAKVQALEDAVPIVGPWAKQIESDVQNKGVVPGLAGLATDALAPMGAGKAVGGIAHSLAPGTAEGALNISKIDRAFGKTPGRAILDETTGVRPASVQASAQAKLGELNSNIDQMAKSHRAPVDINPAISHVDEAVNAAKQQNNVGGVNALQPVMAQLTENPYGINQPFAAPTVGNPNAALSPFQTAEGAMSLKRGLRNQFVKNWNPDAGPQLARTVARGASGVIDQQLDHALGPEFTKTNQRISSLIPVQDAAESVGRNGTIAQKIGGRMRAHTGALAGGIAGGLAGSHHGPLGALAGGAMGILGPEILGSPTAQMGIARTLNSPAPAAISKAFTSGGIVTPRTKRDE